MRYGKALTREIAPGRHRVRAFNTLFSHTTEVMLPGEHVRTLHQRHADHWLADDDLPARDRAQAVPRARSAASTFRNRRRQPLAPVLSETVPTTTAGIFCVHASPDSCATLFLVM